MRILSYNIQAAIASDSYFSYLLRLHRQVMPAAAKNRTLAQIAHYISGFDIVCLQEIDLGGWRNGFADQAAQLAEWSGLPHRVSQTNRVVGKLSRHGNLILSRYPLHPTVSTALPSRIKGRGLLAACADTPQGSLLAANVHLSLGKADQIRQAAFICDLLADYPDVCLSGDFNCLPDSAPLRMLEEAGYRRLSAGCTYPSWRPKRILDHILLKGSLNGSCRTGGCTASDHLPLEAEIGFGSRAAVQAA